MKRARFFVWAAILVGACQINDVTCDKECLEGWLDGYPDDPTVTGDDLAHPLILSRRPGPVSDADKEKPVIIAVHGFTASTFEWLELREYAGDTAQDSGEFLTSLVLLGGHGRDIKDFQATSWEDWGAPILQEYDTLVALGYKHIRLAGASTGATLILQNISAGAFTKRKQAPEWIFLIDPIITPTAKLLSLADVVGPILGNAPNDDLDTGELKHWYTNRPAKQLQQLYELMNLVKNRLEEGFHLPKGTKAKEWKAIHDGNADPVSALQIYKGLTTSDGHHIYAEMVDTRKHVFTRLRGRGSVTPADTLLQLKAFQEMASPDTWIK